MADAASSTARGFGPAFSGDACLRMLGSLSDCRLCDADFSSVDETQELCPNCRKETGLFQSRT